MADENVADLTLEILRAIRGELSTVNVKLEALTSRVDHLDVGFVALRAEMHGGFETLRDDMNTGFKALLQQGDRR